MLPTNIAGKNHMAPIADTVTLISGIKEFVPKPYKALTMY
ncbi:hypothetical protein LAC02_40110 [Ligilactobacillus acidipiscis]|nr:hypothetical protein LAC02_40110 [Ligilactobacillus acidipiscis]